MKKLSLALLFSLAAAPALAHTGAHGAGGLAAGFSHPFLGLDHLLAMIAVGLWAAQTGGRARLAVPAAFIVVMALGGLLGVAGIGLPLVEFGIIGSVLVLGLLIAVAPRLPLWAPMAIVAAFALFHGHAHGTEMPETASGALYGLGFIAATAILHALGLALGFAAARRTAPLARLAGGAVAACGLVLLVV